MARSNRVYTKVLRPDAPGMMVGVRFQPDQLAALDAWIGEQTPPPTRPEAVRALLRRALS